jgi:hypothetical protein
VRAEKEWQGKIMFDAPRHKSNMGLPMDYPRINQFPEWFTVRAGKKYRLVSEGKNVAGEWDGEQLVKGIPVSLKAGENLVLIIKPL